jgi:hypothetical protein
MPNNTNWVGTWMASPQLTEQERPLSVHQALDQLENLSGTDMFVFGQLTFEFENIALYHIPTCERRGEIESSLWLSIGTECLGFNSEVGKRGMGRLF